MIDELVAAVDAAPDEILMMSRMNCHVPDLTSIVVDKQPHGGLRRAFLATDCPLTQNIWPGHLTLGIHDHRYPVTLTVIHDWIDNITFELGGPGDPPVIAWRFTSGGMNRPPRAQLYDGTALRQVNATTLMAGDTATLEATTLHTVACGPLAAWWVEEGPQEQETTRLYTRTLDLDFSELYQPFASAEDVRDFVRAWRHMARRSR
jgi:hypothetical protein